jgi:hypothetical protein
MYIYNKILCTCEKCGYQYFKHITGLDGHYQDEINFVCPECNFKQWFVVWENAVIVSVSYNERNDILTLKDIDNIKEKEQCLIKEYNKKAGKPHV